MSAFREKIVIKIVLLQVSPPPKTDLLRRWQEDQDLRVQGPDEEQEE